jgi:PAS domain S-box-containing protein
VHPPEPSHPTSPIPEPTPLDPRSWLGSIVESSDDAIVSKTLEGIVTTWNKSAERIFGYTAADMVGKPILIMIPEDRQQEEPMILQRIRNGQRVDHFETVRRRKDGTFVNVSVTISPVRDATGKIVGASKIARDITMQKRVEAELVAAREAAERAREVAEAANRAKDHFLSVLSHELRTPLTPVLGAISFIEQNEALPQNVREQVSMIRRNVETQARLVDDLLDLTRIARGKMRLHFEVVDAHTVVRNVIKMFQNEIDEKALAVTTALRAQEYHIWADAGRFQQIILNLLSNAIKFTPKNGSITLRSSNDGADLKIEVLDNGVGIEADVLPRLFTAFEQGEQSINRRFGGLGLGLSIVKALMEMHSGSVDARSAGRDQGTLISLTVPTVSPSSPPGGATAKAVSSALSKHYRILLVEDHADTRHVMTLLLRSFGCEVAVAGSVKEATELALRETFDLLVSDIGLPDGTGLDVMKNISQLQHVRAIAISGFGQEEDLRRSREAGFATHLTKPVNLKTLQEAIEKVAQK